ncbi:Dps family protein [Paenibacillus sp. FSL R7-0204]|uniref:Starvation-inducible DNA-binding protein n=1 Tax=Paenibacillus silagei TaxID=1670801 RepID=A0ABS4NRV9_9BACL|nr:MULTISPECIES: Dps family protein [Paenibacillus]OMF98352.1 DNA starvation/stationary phase protection protein [Paenibacillus sp. FSL R7-0333]ETT53461.1 Ferritin Dps family protein [Paenibacillus sp. FSL R7-269]ETT79666.1 Ferritin Dps family protein [Paenibacillus sp. FSL R7-277]MBP2112165.1 starvation-inducible DNA-binding protein [Paenibacillus silagei]OMF98942.1 DNA starvation/stationary phase protection protein [Paenibacillus sp. FSL R7-0337]
MAKASNKVNTASLEQVLNRQVANLNVLYVKVHNYHWYVKGEQFFALHVKFEELYDDITLKMDEVAERLLSIKGSPAATMKEYLELATIQEATGKEDARGMVQALIEDFATVAEELTEGIELAEEISDQPTADLFIKIRTDLEKNQWMLRAFLG